MIISNAGLSRLFDECSKEENEESVKNDLHLQAEACRRNLKLAVDRLPFNVPSTFEYVLALFLAVRHPYTSHC